MPFPLPLFPFALPLFPLLLLPELPFPFPLFPEPLLPFPELPFELPLLLPELPFPLFPEFPFPLLFPELLLLLSLSPLELLALAELAVPVEEALEFAVEPVVLLELPASASTSASFCSIAASRRPALAWASSAMAWFCALGLAATRWSAACWRAASRSAIS